MRNTLGQQLTAAKAGRSNPEIAELANQWIEQQKAKGRRIYIDRISSEQVRKMCNDLVARPDPMYVEAVAAALGVSIDSPFRASLQNLSDIAKGPIPEIEQEIVNIVEKRLMEAHWELFRKELYREEGFRDDPVSAVRMVLRLTDKLSEDDKKEVEEFVRRLVERQDAEASQPSEEPLDNA